MTEAIAARLGVTAPVVVVTREELGQIHAANPFPDEPDPRRVHAVVLSEPPGAELTAKLDAAVAQSAAKGAPDAAVTVGRTLYLHTPAGYGTQRPRGGGAPHRQLAQGGRDRHGPQLGDDDEAARTLRLTGSSPEPHGTNWPELTAFTASRRLDRVAG